MRIRFLSGEQAGCLKDVPGAEGEELVTSGLAEVVPYRSATNAPVEQFDQPAELEGDPDSDPVCDERPAASRSSETTPKKKSKTPKAAKLPKPSRRKGR